jgi:hypothetical protein
VSLALTPRTSDHRQQANEPPLLVTWLSSESMWSRETQHQDTTTEWITNLLFPVVMLLKSKERARDRAFGRRMKFRVQSLALQSKTWSKEEMGTVVKAYSQSRLAAQQWEDCLSRAQGQHGHQSGLTRCWDEISPLCPNSHINRNATVMRHFRVFISY